MTGFDPPLHLNGFPGLTICSLDDAARFLHEHQHEQHAIHNRAGILRRLQVAITPADEDDAAKAFIGWLEAEGLLLRSAPGQPDKP
ncbi:hypothetical protein RA307_06605 [Xanthobacteraceae bacterium Astr-EGSB]|uniref:hypothetical protein n=1 Tax=Astrobacterium formosum TaxID=3069710 RepID=UPI0027B691D9|nr:hypothetical protein [Xanthobacteraceae bacterium Astr-EGSB]